MVRNTLWRLLLVGFMRRSNATASSTRKAWRSCSGSSASTSTCGAGSSRQSRTTSHCCGCWGLTRQSQSKLHLVWYAGP
uniref:Putative secreted protein n=1 Tax=Ixodes ricinus TaxID=34613 RepID=A0A6B0TVE8_IXORI